MGTVLHQGKFACYVLPRVSRCILCGQGLNCFIVWCLLLCCVFIFQHYFPQAGEQLLWDSVHIKNEQTFPQKATDVKDAIAAIKLCEGVSSFGGNILRKQLWNSVLPSACLKFAHTHQWTSCTLFSLFFLVIIAVILKLICVISFAHGDCCNSKTFLLTQLPLRKYHQSLFWANYISIWQKEKVRACGIEEACWRNPLLSWKAFVLR